MFSIWGVSNQPESYSPGSIRKGRPVEKVSSATPVSRISKPFRDEKEQGGGDGHFPSSPFPYGRQELRPERVPAVSAIQIMSKPVMTLRPEASIEEAWELFQGRRFRHVPVVNQDETLIGLLSDRDVLRAAKNSVIPPMNQRTESQNPKIREVMTSPVLTAHPDTEIRAIAKAMFEERIGAMPIVDTTGRLLGMITRSDILRTVMQNVPFELWI